MTLPPVPAVEPGTVEEALARVRAFALAFGPQSGFNHVRSALLDLSQVFRAEVLAPLLEPAFNRQVATLPRDTLEEKKALCKWVNSMLGGLGLAVAAPDDGSPASLVAGTGGQPAKGRFEFVVVCEDRARRKVLRQELPEYISLTAAYLERKPGWRSAEQINTDATTQPEDPASEDPLDRARQDQPLLSKAVLTVAEMNQELRWLAQVWRKGERFEVNSDVVDLVKGQTRASKLRLCFEGEPVNLRLVPVKRTNGLFELTSSPAGDFLTSPAEFPLLTARPKNR